MRTNEQFKELVYQRADDLNAKNKKNRAIIMRGVTAFSLVMVIGCAFMYGSFFSKNDSSEASIEIAMIADQENINEYYSAYSLHYSALGDSNGSADRGGELQAETAVAADLSYVDSFSFESDKALYGKKDDEDDEKSEYIVSVTSSFVHIDTPKAAVEAAKNECTVEYDITDVYFDADTDIWKVVFYKQNVAGGSQSVYLGSDGTVKLIIYGE